MFSICGHFLKALLGGSMVKIRGMIFVEICPIGFETI